MDSCAIEQFGQFICVSPQCAAVFVRNGPGRGDWGDRDWTELFYFAADRLSRELEQPLVEGHTPKA